ncbi:MAG: rhodanese-like domain-containing protein [Candidatus Bathyarchaeia archaeon]
MLKIQKISKNSISIKCLAIALILITLAVGAYYSYKEISITTLEIPEIKTQETLTRIIASITPKEAYELILKNEDNSNFIIIDLRTLEEFENEHIEGAINLNYYSETFMNELNELDKNKTYLIYCRSGARSKSVLGLMNEFGFKEVYEISGGIIAWKAEGLPTTK